MPIYTKKLNGKQKTALKKYESICGFEPMYQEDLDAGKINFRELWRRNIKWMEGIMAELTNINTNGCFNSDEES